MTLSRRMFLGSAAATVAPAVLRERAHGQAADGVPIDAILAAEPYHVRALDEKKLDYKYQRREVDYDTAEQPGSVVVDPRHFWLYFVLGGGRALRFGVAVGKSGRTWSGEAVVGRKEKWPIWTPTPEHLVEFPKMAKWIPGGMPGGIDNPMGARALYLYQGETDTTYRIHGTRDPELIGKKRTAGCVSLLNVDMIELYERVPVGARVVVMSY